MGERNEAEEYLRDAQVFNSLLLPQSTGRALEHLIKFFYFLQDANSDILKM